MANFEFLCEPELLTKEQTNFICDVLIKYGFDSGKIVFENVGKASDNYGSKVKRIIVENHDGKLMKMVTKIAPNSETYRSMGAVDMIFQNEFSMYAKILPRFYQLQIEAGMKESELLKFPKCYGVYEEKPHEIILLEDLQEQNYVMLDKYKALEDQEVKIILKELAKLHSLSFVLKEKDPAAYQELTESLNNFLTSSAMEENMKLGSLKMEESISSILDDRYKNCITGTLQNIVDEARKLFKYDKGSKYNVIVHGDTWTNNILFKIKDGIPQTCMLIDYQLSFEKSPVNDFLYLIFCCTDFDCRAKYYNDWIDCYYHELDKYLSLYGIKASFVYSKEKMLSDLKRYSKLFLGWSIMLCNVMSMDDETAAQYKESVENNESMEEISDKINAENLNDTTKKLMKTKIQGILQSYVELGYSSWNFEL